MSTPRIHLIFARARNGVIGKDNQLPWHLPEDMAFFKQKTAGGTVVMGRKTWDSLPPRFRPLPGRHNVVITRQAQWQPDPVTDKVSVAGDIAAALDTARALGQPVWVIGGAQIYALALPLADLSLWIESEPKLHHLLPFATCRPALWARSRAPALRAEAALADAELRLRRERDEAAILLWRNQDWDRIKKQR